MIKSCNSKGICKSSHCKQVPLQRFSDIVSIDIVFDTAYTCEYKCVFFMLPFNFYAILSFDYFMLSIIQPEIKIYQSRMLANVRVCICPMQPHLTSLLIMKNKHNICWWFISCVIYLCMQCNARSENICNKICELLQMSHCIPRISSPTGWPLI